MKSNRYSLILAEQRQVVSGIAGCLIVPKRDHAVAGVERHFPGGHKGGWSYPMRAARQVFHTPLPFVLFDTGTYLRCLMKESAQHLKPYGQIGEYLHEHRNHRKEWMTERKVFFDLGDISVLVDPDLGEWEVDNGPDVNWDLDYQFKNKRGRILRCYEVDRDGTFELLYKQIKTKYGK